MKLNAEQQTWLDKLKEKWEDVQFYEDERKEYFVSFSIDRDFYAFFVKESFTMWQFCIYEAPNLTKSMLTKMLSFFEKLAKSEGKFLFVVRDDLVERMLQVEEFLEKKNYELLKEDHNLQFLFNSWNFDSVYIKKNQTELFLEKMKYASAFDDAVTHMMDHIAGMEMADDYYSYIEFLYLDHPFGMELVEKSSQVMVEIKDQKTNKIKQHVIKKPEDMRNSILEAFKETREKQKIRKLFNRNDRYYGVMVEHAFHLSKRDTMYENVYQELRKWYHPIEIEELSSKYQKKDDLSKREIFHKIYVFKLKDILFYLDLNEQIVESMKSAENNDVFSSLIMEKTKKKIVESLKELEMI